MDYFVLRQDERYTNIPMIEQLRTQIETRNIHLTDAHKIPDTSIFYVKADQDTSYLDLLDRQLVLISRSMKQLIDLYQPEYLTKVVVFMDKVMQKQSEYYLPIFKEISCLSPNTQFHNDHTTIRKLVLQESQIQNHPIFQIKESEKPLIVIRLDVAESILRRGFTGILLDRVPIE
ncbi:hypothetical protein [Paenibacillus glacialis]|uniref:Uncharacterized protein n=1 Tax=Paenibacillus glacialis TaxID=494026 RepID=A0A168N7Y7_9BACL|nr:hypothetical protein [Paenibacillus glacialis]OAB45500.1 hypothetical protein PGLA_04410 [Paenibacillus glacialis]